MAADPQALKEEIQRAEVAAKWLTTEYAAEIAEVARRLVEFHTLLAGFERRHHDAL